jgi:antigen flippase
VFAGFILDAMGADFYPRLTAVAQDNHKVNKLVNEQTEIGILLALSGLLATLVFSQWIIRIFYTEKFSQAASLLPWFVLGIFGRVISWPLGFIQLAKGASLWFAITETVAVFVHLAMVWLGLRWLGLMGVAIAFPILYGLYTAGMLWVAFRLSGFRWSRDVIRLLSVGAVLVLATFVVMKSAPEIPATILGAVIIVGTGCYCLRQITGRLGPEHKISRMVLRLPIVGQRLFGGKIIDGR